ncbi:hypothetical protein GE061_001459 [Apolygus lucorum]|uniref:Peptidase C1A papain C-terminal domain-containing protein n=1 Tax=Apolygus lucorum TaxID=248454 RepID=A0A8S9YB91_APOLU|nr:hypothetical protein GE061_001459 [Apolygus lucorum]
MVSPTISTTSCVLCVAILALSSASSAHDRIIDEVNNANTTWRAGPNFRPDYPLESIKRLLGNLELPDPEVPIVPRNLVTYSGAEIPAEFDARKKWPNCPTISHILDQSGCGSCWAVAVASTFSDRLCVGTNGKFSLPISAEELTSCSVGGGCAGGLDTLAWWYAYRSGVVTGGEFNSNIGCQPYELPPCEHAFINGTRIPCYDVKIPNYGRGPACQEKCSNADYKTSFASDKHKIKNITLYADNKSVQEDMMKNGPVETNFKVFEDFIHYKSGVYKHVTGPPLGGHAVRVLGWGVEEGTPYWLVANSWNSDWGDKGLFKILRVKFVINCQHSNQQMVSPTISTTSCVLCVAILALSSASTDFDRIIDEVNNANTTWRAGPNFRSDYSLESIKRLLGNRELPGMPVGPRNLVTYSGAEIPAEFDSRKKWPNCPTISHILDQSGCGSCWAVAVASTFSDRLCVGTNGKFTSPLSAEDLMSCCPGFECNGGNDAQAWTYVQNHGIVTGGDFNSNIGCQPYTFPPCEHHVNGTRIPCDQVKIPNGGEGPACQNKCTNAGYKNTFANDKHKVKKVNVYANVESAQEDIMKNGPIETGFLVYADFMHYKSGVYKHVTGPPLGGHAVRVLGWGVEEGTPYWLVANSWNSDWGDKGLFKILRGTDECQFEDQLMAGEV